MINIVVPMAGAGRRFTEAGYRVPKPFIDVAGVPMIDRVLQNLVIPGARFILIARVEHVGLYEAVMARLTSTYNIHLLTIDRLTEGPACTVFLAARLINSDDRVLMANSDQLVDINLHDFVRDSDERKLHGSILTFHSDHPKWSYAAINEEGLVTQTVEKRVISSHATVGIYYFRRGKEFIESAAEMVAQNERVNGEFYVAPTYNYAIAKGAKIGIYEIKESLMHGLGTPEDLQLYLQHQSVAA